MGHLKVPGHELLNGSGSSQLELVVLWEVVVVVVVVAFDVGGGDGVEPHGPFRQLEVICWALDVGGWALAGLGCRVVK